MNEKEYQTYVEQVTPKVNGWLSFCKAFVSGGIICVIGQCLYNWFKAQGMMHTLANNYTTLILILASVLLTGFNLVGPITKFAGAGYLVPITGFANSVASCAIEFKREGQVFGVGSQIFNIAGPVILYGIVTSWFFGFIYWILISIGLV
ncbi:SpoVA/SpoVAEb family sporulation membrane protein [Frisingicoccus sp.]|uniref:SpoVA/SpoVAEb family sporulation membrane protein n=1 Tax=Frisingicoccus sp. TaxID=1918627 RepID=UPI003AB73DEA